MNTNRKPLRSIYALTLSVLMILAQFPLEALADENDPVTPPEGEPTAAENCSASQTPVSHHRSCMLDEHVHCVFEWNAETHTYDECKIEHEHCKTVTLICKEKETEEVHEHTLEEECYELTCGKIETGDNFEPHTHTTDCYKVDADALNPEETYRYLHCTHEHSEECNPKTVCYRVDEETGELVKFTEEHEDHSSCTQIIVSCDHEHGDEEFNEVEEGNEGIYASTPQCNLPTEEHKHTFPDCYTLTCETPEGHWHSKECYDISTHTKMEHTHSDQCYEMRSFNGKDPQDPSVDYSQEKPNQVHFYVKKEDGSRTEVTSTNSPEVDGKNDWLDIQYEWKDKKLDLSDLAGREMILGNYKDLYGTRSAADCRDAKKVTDVKTGDGEVIGAVYYYPDGTLSLRLNDDLVGRDIDNFNFTVSQQLNIDDTKGDGSGENHFKEPLTDFEFTLKDKNTIETPPTVKKSAKSEMGKDGSIQWEIKYTTPNQRYMDKNIYDVITDTLPEYMLYEEGSLKIDGKDAADPAVNGKTMTIDVTALNKPETTYTITYSTVLEPNAYYSLIGALNPTDNPEDYVDGVTTLKEYTNTASIVDKTDPTKEITKDDAKVPAPNTADMQKGLISKSGNYQYTDGKREVAWTMEIDTHNQTFKTLTIKDDMGKYLKIAENTPVTIILDKDPNKTVTVLPTYTTDANGITHATIELYGKDTGGNPVPHARYYTVSYST